VEKHYNDTLYKGQRHGTSHTDKEIQAAANLLGRDSVVADERTALRNVKVSLFYISVQVWAISVMTSCFRYIQARREAERIARIRASGEVIGGDVVVLGGGTNGGAEGGVPRRGAEEGGADTAVRTGGKTRAWDGCVARIDVSNLSKGRHTDVNEDDDTACATPRSIRGAGLDAPRTEEVRARRR
jgi:hypothetical protein